MRYQRSEEQEDEENTKQRVRRLVKQSQNKERAYWLATSELTHQYFLGLMTWSLGNQLGLNQTQLWVVSKKEMEWEEFLNQAEGLMKDNLLPVYYNHRMNQEDVRELKEHFPSASIDRSIQG